MASYKYVIVFTDIEGGQNYPPDTAGKFSGFAHVIFSVPSLGLTPTLRK